MEIKTMILALSNSVLEAKEKDTPLVFNSCIQSIIIIFNSKLRDELSRLNVVTNKAALGILKKYNKMWKQFSVGVNFNLKKKMVDPDGFKNLCIVKYPKFKDDIEKKLE